MGDQLEKFVVENRPSFDDGAPSDELWNKIDHKLSKKNNLLPTMWKVAAVLFLVSTIYLIVDKKNEVSNKPQLSQEFVQAEDYYISLISERKKLIKEQLSEEQEEMFLYDINQLDSMYTELKKTYQTNASNDRVVDAMINNLQLRLDILNKQLEILENIKNQNNETNSTIQI
ncbi:MAG: hypothetical protein Tsb0034_09290 [Ekhidna sp.]